MIVFASYFEVLWFPMSSEFVEDDLIVPPRNSLPTRSYSKL